MQIHTLSFGSLNPQPASMQVNRPVQSEGLVCGPDILRELFSHVIDISLDKTYLKLHKCAGKLSFPVFLDLDMASAKFRELGF